MQELVDLMRADVAEDAAEALAVEEPVRAGLEVLLVRAEADGLDHAADRAVGDQLGGARDGGNLEAFGKIDGPDAAGSARAFLDGVELFEGGAAGFVDHDVLAGLHRLDGERGAIGGNGGDQDHVDVGVVEDAAAVIGPLELGECLAEFGLGDGVAVAPPARAGAAGGLHLAEHSKDMAVVDAQHAERGSVFGHGFFLQSVVRAPVRPKSPAPRSGDAR